MFNRVLVPLDGTAEAAAAVPAAATLARATSASITLVRVSAARAGDPSDVRLDDQLAEDEVRLMADKLAADGLAVDWLVRARPVAESIIQAADSRDSDVIVMATHARTGLARVFAGSVSERVVAESGRLVLLLAPDGKPLDRIGTLLVPVDGTSGGVLALGAAVTLARATSARLVLLDVVPPTPVWAYGDAGFATTVYIDPAWEDEALSSATTYVDGLTRQLRTSGLNAEGSVLKGQVAPTIHAVAQDTDADMVVMSTHSLTGPARTVLGSVADAVVRTSHRPVLLIRRPASAVDETEDGLNLASEVTSLAPVG